jgi:hypothetical protein
MWDSAGRITTFAVSVVDNELVLAPDQAFCRAEHLHAAIPCVDGEVHGRNAAGDGTSPAHLVESTGQALIGLWTHVVMTYDSTLRQVRLYVNGLLAGVRVNVSMRDEAGPMSFGRSNGGRDHRIHDDAPAVGHGTWSFEGNPNDTSWRRIPTTLSGTASYVSGVRGQAVQLDGSTASASSTSWGPNMQDSFTVSAWAKLSRTDRDATVVAQDGIRMSGFLLQYNKNIGRWIFAAATQDADDAQLVYAHPPAAPSVNTWTVCTTTRRASCGCMSTGNWSTFATTRPCGGRLVCSPWAEARSMGTRRDLQRCA